MFEKFIQRKTLGMFLHGKVGGQLARQLSRQVLRFAEIKALGERFKCTPDGPQRLVGRRKLCPVLNLSDKVIECHISSIVLRSVPKKPDSMPVIFRNWNRKISPF